jgi:SAM-dependent methyltransferase
MNFIQHDLMELTDSDLQTDSISCLHAIEHFGLGRYGDPIDPQGHMKAFKNIISMLRPGGTLYISFPIADQDEVHFNAPRVFSPTRIFDWPDADRLSLKRFDYVGDDGDLYTHEDPRNLPEGMRFACGIYCFEKH